MMMTTLLEQTAGGDVSPLPTARIAPNETALFVERTMTAISPPAVTLSVGLAPEARATLWYQDQATARRWKRLDDLAQARQVVTSRNEQNPWVTIIREIDTGVVENDRVNAFEVLGWADRVYVCGDTARSGSRWLWSSWPVDPTSSSRAVTRLGPSWYRASVYEAQIQTVNDALAQLAPALHAVPDIAWQAPGYEWRARNLDWSANQHLRR